MRINVLSPAFNEADFVGETIESTLKYKGKHFVKHILVDDQSTDKTREIIESYAARNGDRVAIEVPEIKGKNNALNIAFDRHPADAYILLGADDILCADAIDARVEPFSGLSAPAMTLSAIQQFESSSGRRLRRNPISGGGNRSGGAVAFNHGFAKIYFPIPNMLPNEDTWLSAISMIFDPMAFDVDCTALLHRIHPGNSWNRGGDFNAYFDTLTRRNLAYFIARDKFSDKSELAGYSKLISLCSAENFRKQRNLISIVFNSNLTIREKIHFASGTNRLLYGVKKIVAGH